MVLEFSCPKCGMQFKVSPKVAGKRGRCKKCGHQMTIPSQPPPAASVAASGMFRLAGAEAVVKGTSKPKYPSPSPPSQGEHDKKKPFSMPDSVKLAPITADFQKPVPKGKKKVEEEDPRSYKLKPLSKKYTPVGHGLSASKPQSPAQQIYRRQMRNLAGLFGKINDFAYLISIPFILLFLVAIVIQNWNLVLLGATAVVLLNIGRILATMAYLAIVPFKESARQGILFLIPPLTFYFLYKNWKQMKQGALRLVGPILSIVAVVLMFQYVPWLAGTVDLPKTGTQQETPADADADQRAASQPADTKNAHGAVGQ